VRRRPWWPADQERCETLPGLKFVPRDKRSLLLVVLLVVLLVLPKVVLKVLPLYTVPTAPYLRTSTRQGAHYQCAVAAANKVNLTEHAG